MENVVEKLGFLDFFNNIIVGVFTIVGCFIIVFQFGWDVPEKIFFYLVNTSEVNTLFLVLCIFLIITVSYMLGLLCHELYDIADIFIHRTRSFDIFVNDLFKENSCVDNKTKRNRYTDIAQKIFVHNGIAYTRKTDACSEIEWNDELSNYFYSYCLYQVQIRGLNGKIEKLRDIEGLAKAFCISNIVLLLFLMIVALISCGAEALILWFLIEGFSFGALSYAFYAYGKKALKNRIRMTMALFEAIYDKEEKDSLTKNKSV